MGAGGLGIGMPGLGMPTMGAMPMGGGLGGFPMSAVSPTAAPSAPGALGVPGMGMPMTPAAAGAMLGSFDGIGAPGGLPGLPASLTKPPTPMPTAGGVVSSTPALTPSGPAGMKRSTSPMPPAARTATPMVGSTCAAAVSGRY